MIYGYNESSVNLGTSTLARPTTWPSTASWPPLSWAQAPEAPMTLKKLSPIEKIEIA